MNTTNRIVAITIAASLLTACDYAQREEFKKERAEKSYQEAMADYTAGRIDAAIEGFRKAVRDNPGNASARFQLAVLLEEAGHDYLAALCNYKDYILMAEDSDKAKVAKDRADNCERLFATELAKKRHLVENAEIVKELEMALAAKDKAELANAEYKKTIETLQKELDKTKKESAGRLAMLNRIGAADDDVTPRAVDVSERITDDGDDGLRKINIAGVDDDDKKPMTINPEALALNEEEELAESMLLTKRSEVNTNLASSAGIPGLTQRKSDGEGEVDPYAAIRPKFYTVKAGDTLYEIARRYYGKRSYWKKIQEANKTTVPVNGAIRVGQKLELP